MTHRTAPPERVPSAGPPPPPSTPGVSGDDFAAILDSHQARTATAEGRSPDYKTSSRKDEREPRREARDVRRPEERADDHAAQSTDATRQSPAADKAEGDGAHDAAGTDAAAKGADTSKATTGTAVVAAAPAQAAVQPAAGSSQPATAGSSQQTTADSSQPVATTATAPATPQVKVAVEGTVQSAVGSRQSGDIKQVAQQPDAAPTDAKVPAQPDKTVSAPAAAEVVDPKQTTQPAAAEPAKQAPEQPHQPVAQAPKQAPQQQAAPQQEQGQHQSATQAKQPAETSAQPTADSRQPTTQAANAPSEAPAASRQPLPAAGSQLPASAPTTTAAATARPAQQQPPTAGVRLSHAAEAVENTIRIAQSRGVTHARLALRPAELGGVEIHLTSTPAGLVARVTADAHQAAQVLQQAGDDLRRQLQAQGIDLQRLDIGVAGDGRHGAGAAHEEHAGRDGGAARGSANHSGEAGPSAETPAEDTIELPDGVLVDVLA